MEKHLNIIIVEDAHEDVDLIERELVKAGMRFTSLVVKKKAGFENALRTFKPDLILSDHMLPDFSSIAAFNLFQAYKKESELHIPFILLTGAVSEEFAVQCIKMGMDDYILKDRLKRLPSSIESALEKCRIETETKNNEILRVEGEHLANFGSWHVDLITGKHTWSDEMYHIYGYDKPGEAQPAFEMFFSHVHPDDISSLKTGFAQALDNEDSYAADFRIIDNKGNTKYISSAQKIKRNEAGKPVQLVGFNLDITQRRTAEFRMLKSEEKYRSLFDQNPDAVFSLDREGRFKRVNRRLSELAGLSAEELEGMDFRRFFHQLDIERVYSHYLSALVRAPQRYEARFFGTSGKIFTLDITSMPIVVEDEVVGVHSIAKDISGKKELENLLEQINRVTCIGGWKYDVICEKLNWTAAAKKLHEVEADFTPDLEASILFCKAGINREALRNALTRCIEKGIAWDLELQIVTAKGNERWVRSVGDAEMKEGRCIGLYGSFQDIDFQKRAEESIRKSHAEKLRILESFGDGFFEVDQEWTVTYMNHVAEREFSVKREQIVGKKFFDAYNDGVWFAYHPRFHKAMQSKLTAHFEEFCPTRNHWVQFQVYPTASGLSIFFKNITDQKDITRQIENHKTQLKEIAYIQSHEVRAPLARLIGLVDLIKSGFEGEQELPGLLAGIRSSAAELDVLVRKIVRKTE